jgi:hypothetical protein
MFPMLQRNNLQIWSAHRFLLFFRRGNPAAAPGHGS